MMPERTAAMNAAAAAMERLGGEIHSVNERLDAADVARLRRDRSDRRWKVVIVLVVACLIAAVIWTGVVIRENEQDRVVACARGRLELRDFARATAKGTADGLRKMGKANPRNTAPEAQAIVDLFADQFQADLEADLLASLPQAADC